MDKAFLKERIEKTKQLIVAYEDALLAISGGAQHYRLDTSQQIITVTKADLDALTNKLNSLYNLLSTLEMRLYGSNRTQVRPGY